MAVLMIVLSLFLAVLLLILLRPTPVLPPAPRPSPHPRRVSFSLLAQDTLLSLPSSPAPSLPTRRRWSSPFNGRKSSPSDSPVDQFGRLPPSPSFDFLPSPKPPGRLRWSLTSRRRSCSSTLIHPDQPNSPAPSTSSAPTQRTKFTNPFSKHSRSRALSLPSTFNPSSNSPPMPLASPPPAATGRRTLANKFKSIFKHTPPDSPITHSEPVFKTINTRFRRKLVARTQPYGPPWNAPMPIPNSSLPQHSLHEPTESTSSRPTTRKRSVHVEQIPASTFLDELDEKLLLLEQ